MDLVVENGIKREEEINTMTTFTFINITNKVSDMLFWGYAISH